MEMSKLKFEVYDFLGIVIPGLIAICEGWILVRGWTEFTDAVTHIGGVGLTLLIFAAFGAGNLVQELGAVAVQRIKGARHSKTGRDNFWRTDDATRVRSTIKSECGLDVQHVDSAFDYCLTRIKSRFAKRDLFVAVSDMCRSFLALAVMALIPFVRTAHDLQPAGRSLEFLAAVLLLLLVGGWLAWKRMLRFRELSETTVFRTYLAVAHESERRSRRGSSQTE
jgi:hypothetical protein